MDEVAAHVAEQDIIREGVESAVRVVPSRTVCGTHLMGNPMPPCEEYSMVMKVNGYERMKRTTTTMVVAVRIRDCRNRYV